MAGEALSDGWEWLQSLPSEFGEPDTLPSSGWRPASVPGTAAQAMREAGVWSGQPPLALDDTDIWYRTSFHGTGRDRLTFAGLATIAEVWINGAPVLRSENMFLAHEVEVETGSDNALHICFRSLTRWLAARRGRARWRPRMISPPTLRFARTTLLGRMPGWCPVIHPVGPWRPISMEPADHRFKILNLRCTVSGNHGIVELAMECPGSARVHVGEYVAELQGMGDGRLQATLRIPHVDLWWPHTHGVPHLYRLDIETGCETRSFNIGFRTIEIERGPDTKGFGLIVNGVPIFCRGACWTNADIVTLPCNPASYAPLLNLARDAGMNMIRLGGTMLYEADAFYQTCNELGLMVWQDFMLSNFDYPIKNEDFRASLCEEAKQFICRTQYHPCLAVLCGGSEVMQQVAMFGLPRPVWEDGPHQTILPEICSALRPDVPYVPNSPSGGDWPFLPNESVTHYYGVGAYQLPLTDARRSDVRFTSECLGFANVPCAKTVAEALPVSSTTDPRWKQATPHDVGVSWDFEDVRDHYAQEIFGIDPIRLRYEDFERYLDVARAVSCVVMETVFAEWRRGGSRCAGGLVWQLQDLVPGAGWGVIDALRRPKAAWHALSRAFRPRQLVFTDEGLNGLHLHIINETDQLLHGNLTLVCLRNGRIVVREVNQQIEVAPRTSTLLPSTSLIKEFFDITYAYRFGPPFHNVTAAWLTDSAGSLIADAYHFPQRSLSAREELGLQCTVEATADGWRLNLTTPALAQFVHIEDEHFRATEDWFHLPPGLERRIRLVPFDNWDGPPDGEVRALNLSGAVRFRGRI